MTPSPGYIQGYVPGVRENGGQYTHAALWTVLAHARLGDGDRADELFAMLNPINHAPDAASVDALPRRAVRRRRRRLFAAAAHRPRRLDWYTGSAGWMYRVGVEAILGLDAAPRRAAHRSLHSARLAGLRGRLRTADAEYRIWSRTPTACAAACGGRGGWCRAPDG